MKQSNGTTGADRLTRWAREHGAAVRGFLFASLRDSQAAEDLLQEVFVRAWAARRRYTESGSERGYLLRIADRLVRDFRRSRRRFDRPLDESLDFEPADQSESPIDYITKRETASQLNKALNALSDEQRRTLLLRYYGNLSFAEIAELTGRPLNTVLSHCRRGLRALRGVMVKEFQ